MTVRRTLTIVVAAIGWLALGLQLWISIVDHSAVFTTLQTIARYLIFFTVLTNILVALIATRAAIRPDDRSGLNDPRFEMAVAVSIIIVGVVYGLLLGHLVTLSGFRLFVDSLLHKLQPLLFAILWWTRRTGRLVWRDMLWAPALPAAYGLYALARGKAEGFYAYWFFNANTLTPAELLRNSVAMLAVAMLVGAALIWADRRQRH